MPYIHQHTIIIKLFTFQRICDTFNYYFNTACHQLLFRFMHFVILLFNFLNYATTRSSISVVKKNFIIKLASHVSIRLKSGLAGDEIMNFFPVKIPFRFKN